MPVPLNTTTKLQVQPLDWQTQLDAYEAFLNNTPGGLLYYSPAYLTALQGILNTSAEVLLAVDPTTQAIEGCLPLMSIDGPQGILINSLPFFGSHGGILASSPEAVSALTEAYLQHVDAVQPASATLITNPFSAVSLTPLQDTLEAQGRLNATDERIAQTINLTDWQDWSVDGFVSKLEETARRNVRKALKSGVTVTIENTPEALAFLRDTHWQTMSAQGGTIKPPAFFEGLFEWFTPGTLSNLYMARVDGQAIATLLLLYYSDTVEYFVPVTLPEYRNSQPVALMLYEALKDAAEKGYTRFNWGGTWLSQTGVYQFKKKWNTTESNYQYWVTLSNQALRQQTPQALFNAYPYWYALPYSCLEGAPA